MTCKTQSVTHQICMWAPSVHAMIILVGTATHTVSFAVHTEQHAVFDTYSSKQNLKDTKIFTHCPLMWTGIRHMQMKQQPRSRCTRHTCCGQNLIAPTTKNLLTHQTPIRTWCEVQAYNPSTAADRPPYTAHDVSQASMDIGTATIKCSPAQPQRKT